MNWVKKYGGKVGMECVQERPCPKSTSLTHIHIPTCGVYKIAHWLGVHLLCLGGRSPRHTVVVVCLCVCMCVCFRRKLSRARSPRPLKIKLWNLQCKLNTILSWNESGGFWIGGFIVKLWHDLRSVAHLDGHFLLSWVHRKATCLQRTAFQLGSSIYTTRQTMS